MDKLPIVARSIYKINSYERFKSLVLVDNLSSNVLAVSIHPWWSVAGEGQRTRLTPQSCHLSLGIRQARFKLSTAYPEGLLITFLATAVTLQDT